MNTEAGVRAIRNPGSLRVPPVVRGVLLGLLAAGVGVFLEGLRRDPQRAWAAFLLNHFYFMGLAVTGGFLVSLHWLTGATWSAPIRRVAESFTRYLPFALLTLAALYLGRRELFVWAHPERMAQPPLAGKAGYLSPGFFFLRNGAAIALWILLLWKLVGNSLAQDRSGDPELSLRNRRLAPAFVVVFALTFTMASFDQVMSLDPRWFSTIFGVYCFAGAFYGVLALTGVLVVCLRREGTLLGVVNDDHLHDLGRYMFAFAIFWAYIAFCQFLLIWYANLPEETGYFLRRFHGGWLPVSIFLLVGKFGVPFVWLLPRDAKRSESMIVGVGLFMLAAQWIDVLWMVQPEFFPEGPRISWPELGITIGFSAAFGLAITRFLSRHNAVAIGDPRLAEAVFHHRS
jgi:hypothetical protein